MADHEKGAHNSQKRSNKNIQNLKDYVKDKIIELDADQLSLYPY